MKMISPVLALIAAATATSIAGTITYYWDINDTGSDTFLYSGEDVINFKMYALMDPQQIALAGSAYEIRGGDEYSSAGVVIRYDNLLDTLTDEGELQENNDILNIESFQLPPFIGGLTDPSNPILLYEIDWEVTQSFTLVTLFSSNHLYNEVYTDQYGSSESYDAITTTATVLIPSPVSVLPLAGLFMWCRRR